MFNLGRRLRHNGVGEACEPWVCLLKGTRVITRLMNVSLRWHSYEYSAQLSRRGVEFGGKGVISDTMELEKRANLECVSLKRQVSLVG